MTGVSLVFEQALGRRRVAQRDGVEQRRAAILVLVIDVSAVLHQQVDA